MSTGLECYFSEEKPGVWFYELEIGDHNRVGDIYGSGEFNRFGPFDSFPRAETHLQENHANPGGYSIGAHPNGDGSSKR